jgi:hypothetical protein
MLPQVLSLNGTKVINMAQLVELVDSCTEPFLHFHLDYEQKVCLDVLTLLRIDEREGASLGKQMCTCCWRSSL